MIVSVTSKGTSIVSELPVTGRAYLLPETTRNSLEFLINRRSRLLNDFILRNMIERLR